MKTKKLLWLLCAFALLLSLCACGGEMKESAGVTVYRRAEGGDTLLCAETVEIPAGETAFEAALQAFFSKSTTENLSCPLPSRTLLLRYTLKGHVLTLYLSQELQELSHFDLCVAENCLALTFCAFDEVDAITIISDGSIIAEKLTGEKALLTDRDANPAEKTVHLYFAEESGRYLAEETRCIAVSEEELLPEHIVQELLRGPENAALFSPLPEGTKLLSAETEGRCCTVNLSVEFYGNRPSTAIGERLAVYSLVNSLCSLSDIDSVKLLANGSEIYQYVHLSLSSALSFSETAIGPAVSALGERDAEIYLPTPEGDALVALPCLVSVKSEKGFVGSLAGLLLSGFPEQGYAALWTEPISVISSALANGVYTLNLSDNFVSSCADEAELLLRVQSLTATLTATEDVDALSILVGGTPLTLESRELPSLLTNEILETEFLD